ncbi:MAG: oligosaccharide flippase family protein [Rhodocyclaceae bacterium]|nr:oligosaccharide flippase family protein [Rhodocyclaceae bacterium]
MIRRMPVATNRFGGARDVAALLSNTTSLAVVAVAGIAVSAMLANGFGVAVVGQFNQLAMLHVVCAQVAAMGVHLSCLHYLSGTVMDRSARFAGSQAAVAVVVLSGSATGLCLFALAEFWERLLDSPGLADGVRWLGPAVALFGVNKVLLALLNAGDRLHAYAFLQSLRPLIWLGGTMAIVRAGQVGPERLGILLFVGEAIAAVCGAVLLSGQLLTRFDPAAGREWVTRHFNFGWRAMPSHLIIDLNTRIDVLILAIFVSDSIVGVYSFVALLAEGIFQIGVLVRTVINRRLVSSLVARDQAAIGDLKRSAGHASLGLTLAASVVVLAAFEPAIAFLKLDPALLGGLLPLAILLLGVTYCAKASPFWMAIALAGRPAEHSMLMLALCALNIAINVAAVPVLGMLGAAIATAVMFAAFPVMLRWMARRTLEVEL